MRAKICFFLSGLFWGLTVFCQQKDYTVWISQVEIGEAKIPVLRVPSEKAGSKIQSDVYMVQEDLAAQRKNYYLRDQHVPFGFKNSVEKYCSRIEKSDSTFPVHYYMEEVQAYLDWEKVRKDREDEANRFTKDSIRIARLKENFLWINADSVWVRTKPDSKSAVIGKLYRLSYVKAYEVDGKPDWVELEFGGHSGFIKEEDLGYDWDDMALIPDELEQLKAGAYFDFEPTAFYTAKLKKEADAEERALNAANNAPQKRYIRGPKGGCYFINSNNNRQYVDRKFCN